MSKNIVTEFELEKIYRPSSTLIIAAKSNTNEQGYNYRLLLAKRSVSTEFAPNHHVFPGGVYDQKADASVEWLAYFREFGVERSDLDKLSLRHLPNRPKPLMRNCDNLSRDTSLRITAIREAFEEVGLLFCIKRNDWRGNGDNPNYAHKFDKTYWQQKVHNNGMEFLNLCKYLNVIPDLWSLHEWSIWRSPPTALKKYDTVIYIIAMDHQPDVFLEPTEIDMELWSTPFEAIRHYENHRIWLAPLQFYEISRLANCLDLAKLQRFAKKRNCKGSTLIMLVYFQCTDFLVAVLPGDDYYPACTTDHKEIKKLNMTLAEFNNKAKNIHRLIYYNMHSLSIISNIKPIDGHFSPVLQIHSRSKL